MGHAVRSLILARELGEKKHITYLMKPYAEGQQFIKDHGFDVVSLPDDSDAVLVDFCRRAAPDLLICDLIETPYSLLFDYCRSCNLPSIVFDTKGCVAGTPHMIINANITAKSEDYSSLLHDSRLCLGTSYFMTPCSMDALPIKEKVTDVIITMGGSDPANLTAIILKTLKGRFPLIRLHVVLGPSFSGHDLIRSIADYAQEIIIHENPPDFLALLSTMDIVVTAGGLTLYEAAWLGRPSIAIPSIDHEEPVAKEFYKKNCALMCLPPDSAINRQTLKERLGNLVDNYNVRLSMSKNGKALVDGNGKARVLRGIINLSNHFS